MQQSVGSDTPVLPVIGCRTPLLPSISALFAEFEPPCLLCCAVIASAAQAPGAGWSRLHLLVRVPLPALQGAIRGTADSRSISRSDIVERCFVCVFGGGGATWGLMFVYRYLLLQGVIGALWLTVADGTVCGGGGHLG